MVFINGLLFSLSHLHLNVSEPFHGTGEPGLRPADGVFLNPSMEEHFLTQEEFSLSSLDSLRNSLRSFEPSASVPLPSQRPH